MITTAVVGAGVVALVAGAGIKDAKVDSLSMDSSPLSDTNSARDDAAARANRGERALTTSISKATDAWVLPMHNYSLTSGYGYRWGKLHKGVDLAMPEGTPYAAVHDGVVVRAAWDGGYGLAIVIEHSNGFQTVYGHSSELLVKVGQQVRAGDIIGRVGNTGHSFGSHLHLEIHVNGVAADPLSWFKKHGVDLKMEIEDVYSGVIN